jgi:hypothetical protein
MRNLQDHAKPDAPPPAHPRADGEAATVVVPPVAPSGQSISYKLG